MQAMNTTSHGGAVLYAIEDLPQTWEDEPTLEGFEHVAQQASDAAAYVLLEDELIRDLAQAA